jgi:hypothetical protein
LATGVRGHGGGGTCCGKCLALCVPSLELVSLLFVGVADAFLAKLHAPLFMKAAVQRPEQKLLQSEGLEQVHPGDRDQRKGNLLESLSDVAMGGR